MTPLEISTRDSSEALDRARTAFNRAKADARIASTAAYVLMGCAFLVFSLFQQVVVALVVIAGSLALMAITHRRVNALERRLWWHQARNGLVAALSEQSERQVIDLRDVSKKETSN